MLLFNSAIGSAVEGTEGTECQGLQKGKGSVGHTQLAEEQRGGASRILSLTPSSCPSTSDLNLKDPWIGRSDGKKKPSHHWSRVSLPFLHYWTVMKHPAVVGQKQKSLAQGHEASKGRDGTGFFRFGQLQS